MHTALSSSLYKRQYINAHHQSTKGASLGSLQLALDPDEEEEARDGEEDNAMHGKRTYH